MNAPTPQAAPKKSGKTLVIGLAVLLLAAAASAGTYLYMGSKGPAQAKVEVPKDPIFVPLEPFTVNLPPGSPSRFLHVAVTIKVDDAVTEARLKQYLPEVRSRVLAVLGEQKGDNLLSNDEKKRMASELQLTLTQPFIENLPPQNIASVMFTTFVLQ
jgi:flagellar FliL protein